MILLNDATKTHMMRLDSAQMANARAEAIANHVEHPWTRNGAVGNLLAIPILAEPDYQGRMHEVNVFRNGVVYIKHGDSMTGFDQRHTGPCASVLGSGGAMECPLACALTAGRVSIKGLEPGKYQITYAVWWTLPISEDVIVKWTGGPPTVAPSPTVGDNWWTTL